VGVELCFARLTQLASDAPHSNEMLTEQHRLELTVNARLSSETALEKPSAPKRGQASRNLLALAALPTSDSVAKLSCPNVLPPPLRRSTSMTGISGPAAPAIHPLLRPAMAQRQGVQPVTHALQQISPTRIAPCLFHPPRGSASVEEAVENSSGLAASASSHVGRRRPSCVRTSRRASAVPPSQQRQMKSTFLMSFSRAGRNSADPHPKDT